MKVSCVIISYNNGDKIEQAIRSALDQTRPFDEIVVADDASTDGSRERILALSHEYPTVKPTLRERNIGASANRDLAIRDACGDLVTALDGDDYFLPDKNASEVEALERYSASVAYSDVKYIFLRRRTYRVDEMGDFATLDAAGRVRWVVGR